MNRLKKIGFGIAFLYFLMCATLYFVQDRLIFVPHPLSQDHQFRIGEELEIEVAPAIKLNCLLIKESPSKGAILYLHGNRGNIRRCIRQAQMMSGNGYDIFIPDYRGYGKSDGKVYSEAQLFSDVQKIYDYIKQFYTEDQIVIVGYSLGTGMASYLAANNEVKALAMVAPYYCFVDLKNSRLPFIPDFVLKYPLKSHEFLPNVSCPITLFHGTEDKVIPYDSSERLVQLNAQKIKLIPMNGANHRRSIFDDRFRRGMREILN